MKKTKADAGERKAKVKKHTQPRDTRDARDTRRDEEVRQLLLNAVAWSPELILPGGKTAGEEQWEQDCPDKPWWEMDAEQLLKHAWRVVSALESLAYKGDGEAAIALVNISVRCADTPERLLPESPALQAKLRKAAYWPVCIPVNKKKRDLLVAQLSARGFAKDCELNEAGKVRSDISRAVWWTWDFVRAMRGMKAKPPIVLIGPARKPFCHEKLSEWAVANAKELPHRLTKENAKVFGELTKPLLEIFWGLDFETHSDFAQYMGNEQWKKAPPHWRKNYIRDLWVQSWESSSNLE